MEVWGPVWGISRDMQNEGLDTSKYEYDGLGKEDGVRRELINVHV